MIVIFFPAFVNNLPPPLSIIAGTTLLLGVIWTLLIVFFKSSVFLSKQVIFIAGFAIFLFMGSLIIWSDRIYSSAINMKWIIIDIFGVYLATIMFLYYIKARDFKGIAIVSLTGLVLIIITSITSIIGLSLFPLAVRQLTSGGAGSNESTYAKIGIAGYTFWIGIIYLFPSLVYLFKYFRFSRYKRVLAVLSVFTLFFALIKAQVSTAIVLAVVFIVYSFIARGNFRSTGFIVFTVAILILFVVNQFIADFFYYVSGLLNSELLQSRIYDVGLVFELQDFDPNSGQTYFSESRLSRIFISIESFLRNPFFGDPITGGHSTWFDKLAIFGLFGFIPWIIIFRQQVSLHLKVLDKQFLSYYFLSVIACIVAGILTTTANSVHSMVILFFVVPGISFIKHIANSNFVK